jgi:hypothetical protein
MRVLFLALAAACSDDREPAEPREITTRPSAPAGDPAAVEAIVEPTFGAIELAPRFLPDPHVVSGTSGGTVDAHSLDPSCNGFIGTAPDHALVLQGPFDAIRVVAWSNEDVTLVVRDESGRYTCADDSEGTNPAITLMAAASGRYDLWVGSYHEGANTAYRLGVSELLSTEPSRIERAP